MFEMMKVFVAVAELESFVLAARRLNMSPPTVSRLVAQLEQELKVQLLNRTTRSVSLTAHGDIYLVHARQIVEAVEKARDAVSDGAGQLQGRLRIGCQPGLAEQWIMPIYMDFRDKYPNIQLELQIDPHPIAGLGRYDLALSVIREGEDSNVTARQLFTADGILCAAPSYVAKYGLPETPADLLDHICLTRDSQHQRNGVINLWRRDGSMRGPPAFTGETEPDFTSNDTNCLLDLVRAGAGISVFPHDRIVSHLVAQDLVHILPDWITGRYTVIVALPSHRHIPARCDAFLSALSRHGKFLQDNAILT